MPASGELVAADRSEEEVRELIGADWLVYQDLEDLERACQHDDAAVKEFDTSCFSGQYVTSDVTPEYLARLGVERSDAAKASRRTAQGTIKVVQGV
jgi:amidophosphoribosyltransferase